MQEDEKQSDHCYFKFTFEKQKPDNTSTIGQMQKDEKESNYC